jgi:hypothetical protein
MLDLPPATHLLDDEFRVQACLDAGLGIELVGRA